MAAGRCRQRASVGRFSEWRHLYPAFPYTSYQRMNPKDVADLAAFLRTCAGGQGQSAGERAPLSLFHPPRSGLVEASLFRQFGPSPRPVAKRTMEPRPLSRRRPRPLRRMPHAAGFFGRNGLEPRARGRALARRPWQGREPERRRLFELDRRRHCRGSDQRLHACRRRPWRRHDRRCAQPRRIARVRPPGDRGLSQEPARRLGPLRQRSLRPNAIGAHGIDAPRSPGLVIAVPWSAVRPITGSMLSARRWRLET